MLAFASARNVRRLAACVLLEFVSFLSYLASIFGTDMLMPEVLSLLAIFAALIALLELLDALRPAREAEHA